MTDEEVVAAASLAGYTLVERHVVDDRPIWGWVGSGLAPGWWLTRQLAIDRMREILCED